MREQQFTLTETREIFLQEVGPAFAFNLLAIGGEWVGWEESFVTERVQLRLGRPALWRQFTTFFWHKQMQLLWEHTLPYLEQELSREPILGETDS